MSAVGESARCVRDADGSQGRAISWAGACSEGHDVAHAHFDRRYQATSVRRDMNSVSADTSTTHSRIWLRYTRMPALS